MNDIYDLLKPKSEREILYELSKLSKYELTQHFINSCKMNDLVLVNLFIEYFDIIVTPKQIQYNRFEYDQNDNTYR